MCDVSGGVLNRVCYGRCKIACVMWGCKIACDMGGCKRVCDVGGCFK